MPPSNDRQLHEIGHAVARMLARMGVLDEDAQEIVQDCFVALWPSLESLPTWDDVRCLAMDIAKKRWVDRLRKKRGRRHGQPVDRKSEAWFRFIGVRQRGPVTPMDQAETNEQMERIRPLLARLSEPERLACLLRYQGWHYLDIARLLGRSIENADDAKAAKGWARQLVSRTIRKLRSSWEDG